MKKIAKTQPNTESNNTKAANGERSLKITTENNLNSGNKLTLHSSTLILLSPGLKYSVIK